MKILRFNELISHSHSCSEKLYKREAFNCFNSSKSHSCFQWLICKIERHFVSPRTIFNISSNTMTCTADRLRFIWSYLLYKYCNVFWEFCNKSCSIIFEMDWTTDR